MTERQIKPSTHLSPFDRRVMIFIALLILGIGAVIVLGDRVGVQLVRVGPVAEARSTSPIIMQFNESMNRDSVAPRLKIQPAVEGEITWSGTTLSYRPSEAFTPGAEYTVILERGAESETGRAVLSEYRFSFRVRTPRVAYLAPADSAPQNVWVADPAQPDSAQQVTFSPSGVGNFDISPDGTQLAFAERNSNTGGSDIKLLHLESGALTQLTNCPDSDCTTPVWRPDGSMIAYERVDFNTEFTDVGVSPTRVWLLDLTTNPVSTRPLFPDSQILGYAPQWSADGRRIAVFDRNQGILVYDFGAQGESENIFLIPSNYGTVGALAPDGTRLVFPEVILDGSQARSHLKVADLSDNDLDDLNPVDEPTDDDAAVWHPDSERLAIARRYLDNRYTRGRQVYLYDTTDNSVEPLIVDERYANGYFSWDPTGTQLVLQRFPELTEDGQPNNTGRPEIWTYNVATDELIQVTVNAYHPLWVP